MMRADKFLTDMGIGTRSEVKKLIKSKRITLNGTIVTNPGLKVDENATCMYVDGKKIEYEQYVYYLLNKPQGVVSAVRDGLSKTVTDILKDEPIKDLFPVGRLDKDTVGLLLITNDGQLSHELLSPKHHVDKEYHAITDKELNKEQLHMFEQGVDIGDDKPTLPASITYEGTVDTPVNGYLYKVIIHEGRYHQVKRMFEAFGASVCYLKRMAMGNLRLPKDLEEGKYIKISLADIKGNQNEK